MKIIRLTFAVLTLLMCALFYSVDAANTVRVGLRYGSGAPSSVTVGAESGLNVVCSSPSCSLTADKSEVVVSITGGALAVDPEISYPEPTADPQNDTASDDGEPVKETPAEPTVTALLLADASAHITLTPANGNEAISFGGVKYRGGIELFIGSAGTITVVNVLSVEDYLCGVLPSEVYTSWHAEALKANAVAARTFTYSKISSSPHTSAGFDICATTHCQAYNGKTKENNATSAAVAQTKDLVLYYNGSLALTAYHSSSGGATESASTVWGGGSNYPYLASVVTPYEDYRHEPGGKWVTFLQPAEFSTKLAPGYSRINYSLLDIDSFEFTRQPSGYISSVTVTDKKGGKTTVNSSDSVRNFFASLVKSANFGMAEAYMPSSDTSAAVNIIQSDGSIISRSAKPEPIEQVVLSPEGEETVMYVDAPDGEYGFDYIGSDGKLHHTDGLTRVLALDGQGNGHGVGMSQFGSEDMAKAGFSCADILSTYYPGTTLAAYTR